MAHIRVIDETEAEGELAELYGRVSGDSGHVANILKVQSLHPRALATHFALYREIMFGPGPLSRSHRELIAVTVSQANRCEY